MSEFKLKIPKDINKRIDKLYEVLKKTQDEGEDTTEIEIRVLKLEKRYIEYALRIKLTDPGLRELKSIVDIKILFPGSRVFGVGKKPFDWIIKEKDLVINLNKSNPDNGEGGDADMGFNIDAEELIEPGTYDATIANVESTEGKYGKSLKITFEIGDGRDVNGLFPPKATPNNKTGILFKKALGEIRYADSDELIGKTVKILIAHKQSDGLIYTNVSKIL